MNFHEFIYFVLTYVLYMCMFPACCFHQRTYVAQSLVNGVLNDTWTHSCLQFEWFSVGLGGFYIEVILPFSLSEFTLDCFTDIYIYIYICACVCVSLWPSESSKTICSLKSKSSFEFVNPAFYLPFDTLLRFGLHILIALISWKNSTKLDFEGS